MLVYTEISKMEKFILTAYKTSRIERIMRKGIIWKK